MSGRMILLTVASLLLIVSDASAQDLNQYDPAGYSGGYAEGASGPLGFEQLYPYDAQEPWQHGYIQYMPFYGAYQHFRPYNYKTVLSQTQTAAGWGMSAKMPYSQQFWHKYHEKSRMSYVPDQAYESLPMYRQPPVQQPAGQLAPTQRAPAATPKVQLIPQPVPQPQGALEFIPVPAPPVTQNEQRPQGISYQQPLLIAP
ncbi:MAG: hypothetical protein JKY95_05530 [Planctomycetaceae bacterium]|nr:hypothetical protein [Planctomycetaceae bacterium]